MRPLGQQGLALVRIRDSASVRAAVASLERDPSVAFAEPNYLYRVSGPPDDPGAMGAEICSTLKPVSILRTAPTRPLDTVSVSPRG